MLRPQGWAIEREHAPALEYAVDDRVGEILVVQYVAPRGERFVGGEDHRALLPMAIVTTWKSMFAASVPYVRYPTSSTTMTEGWTYRASASASCPRRNAAERSSMSSAAVTNSASKPF